MLNTVGNWYKCISHWILTFNTQQHKAWDIEAEMVSVQVADDIFKCIFFNENIWISIQIWLKFAPRDPSDTRLALVQIMAWRRTGDKPLYEPIIA